MDDAVAHGEAHDAGAVGVGHVREVGRRDDDLPDARHAGDEPLAALGVELAHHVVEQQQRRVLARVGEGVALGQQQREQRHPLLALRAVGAQLAAVAREHAGRRGAGRGP